MAKRRLIDLDKIKPIDFPSIEMDGLDVVRYLNTLPTVDAVEVVHGCWVKRQDICEALELEEAYSCSECGKSSIVKHNFCNRCGAKMDGGSDG